MGNLNQSSPERITALFQGGIFNQCHKYVTEIACRMYVPECIAAGTYISPCQSTVREALNACKQFLAYLNFQQAPADTDFVLNYYSQMFPSDGLCFDVNVTCNQPQSIDHGTYSFIQTGYQSEYPVNTSVVYTCDEDYDIEGESKSFCNYSGNWTSVPLCVLRSQDKTKVIITASVLSTLVLIIIIISLLGFKYRQELAVIIYAKYGFRFRTFKEEERKYDAFIAYNLEDISFVKRQLMGRLEKCADPPYSVCIHHRDFELGDWIADNIIKAVAGSKRTIIVLSQNFLNSQWCRFEFSQAHFRLMQDQSFKIIIIALEDPKNFTNVPKVIKSYIKTGTYMTRDDKLFWEKLFYQMPSGHKAIQHKNQCCNDEEIPV